VDIVKVVGGSVLAVVMVVRLLNGAEPLGSDRLARNCQIEISQGDLRYGD